LLLFWDFFFFFSDFYDVRYAVSKIEGEKFDMKLETI